MGKVGNLTGLGNAVEPDSTTRGRDGRSLRVILVGLAAVAIALVAVAISGAAPGTDASVKNFQQCANGAPPSTATDCPTWINGILQSSNSHYAEDEVTPQRVILVLPKDGPLTGRTVEIKYLTRKGGVHAYDSLATWNYTQTTADECADLNPADCVGGAASEFAIPSDPIAVADNDGPGSPTSGHQLPGQKMVMYGGTITGVSVPTHSDPSGTSDEEATLTVTYSVPDLSTDRKVMLLFGGHIAPSIGPRGWGAGVGAGSISGGPYHIRICKVDDDSSGCRDNQIQSGAILAPANVVIEKVAVGGNDTFAYTATGGISNFNIATTNGSGSQLFTNIAAGTYTVTESAPPAGWDFTSLDCVDEDGNSSETGATSNIVLAAGETATCTYTNTKRGSIVIDKVTAPSGDPESFPFALTGGPDAINQPFSLTDAATPHDSGLVKPGTYVATETNVPAGWDLTGQTCSNGSEPSSISLEAGQTVTCTFTNTKRGALVVYKQVVNDNGGSAAASAWQMNVAGPTNLNFPGSLAGTSNPVLPGSYTVGESGGPSGYGLSYPSTGLPVGVAQNDCNAQGGVSVGPGETKHCVLRNDDDPAHLTLVKTVTNDNGGNAVPADWLLTADGTGANDISGAGGFDQDVDADTYSLSESGGPSGYTAGSWSCVKNGGAPVTGSSIALGIGDSATCTIDNDDDLAHLKLVKTVTNDNGGTAVPGDFTLSADGPSPISGAGGVESDVDAGTYTLSETNLPGYTAGSWSCVKDEGAPVPGSSIVLGVGESATCTIDNDDEPATLIVKKVVVNDNGGTAMPDDFSFQVNEGQAQPFEVDGRNELTVNAGTYEVSEPAVAGYTTTYDNCSELVIANGGSEICTITNDDEPAALIVRKVVINDNGGTKQAQDFSFKVNGGAAQAFEADGQNDLIVDAGSYNVTEVAIAGYTTTYSNCSNVVIPSGGTATCTITNNDVPPGQGSITVSKSASPTTLKEPGGPVTYSVTITNTSADVVVTVDNVVDDKFGDLDDSGGSGCFDVPINLAPGQNVNCTFTRQITGVGGTAHVNVVSVTGHDPAGNTLRASDDARVDLTPRLIDLVIVKEASSPTALNGIVNYSLTVTNRGPDTATNVQVADPAPAGITYLSASPSQGSCSFGPSLVTCSLGTIAPGQTVTIAITARATTVGSHTNTATVAGSGGRETNPADNVDSAVTIVPAPLRPPVVKPTQPATFCLALSVTPQMVKADGKPDRVSVKVTAGPKRMKGVRVVVSGAGVRKSAVSNGKGVAALRINPKRSGIITITALEPNQKVCGPKRIGVVGVFLPPVTG